MTRVVLIGSEPERMTRLRRTCRRLRSLGIDVSVLNPCGSDGRRLRDSSTYGLSLDLLSRIWTPFAPSKTKSL
ncbi:MAG: hypothetical protein QXS20_06520 [Candidatus Thorarchaeota archaeon]